MKSEGLSVSLHLGKNKKQTMTVTLSELGSIKIFTCGYFMLILRKKKGETETWWACLKYFEGEEFSHTHILCCCVDRPSSPGLFSRPAAVCSLPFPLLSALPPSAFQGILRTQRGSLVTSHPCPGHRLHDFTRVLDPESPEALNRPKLYSCCYYAYILLIKPILSSKGL